jgi:hypothetical protein
MGSERYVHRRVPVLRRRGPSVGLSAEDDMSWLLEGPTSWKDREALARERNAGGAWSSWRAGLPGYHRAGQEGVRPYEHEERRSAGAQTVVVGFCCTGVAEVGLKWRYDEIWQSLRHTASLGDSGKNLKLRVRTGIANRLARK